VAAPPADTDFTPGCKAMLVSQRLLPALQRDNCKLIDWPIATLSPVGVRTKRRHRASRGLPRVRHRYDVHLNRPAIPVTGLGGRSLSDEWTDGAQAYKSTSAHGYPNLFFMTGPNSGPDTNSLLVYVEGQLDYAVRGITTILDSDLRYLDVRHDVQRRYNERIQRRLTRHVDVGLQQLVFDQGRTQRVDVPGVRHPVSFGRCEISSTPINDAVEHAAVARELIRLSDGTQPNRPALKPAPSRRFGEPAARPQTRPTAVTGGHRKRSLQLFSNPLSAIPTVYWAPGIRIEDLPAGPHHHRNIRVLPRPGLLPPPLRVAADRAVQPTRT